MPPEVPAAETIQGTEIAEAMESEDFSGLDEEGRTIAQRLQAMVDDALGMFQVTYASTEPVMVLKETRMWMFDGNSNPIASAKPDFAAIKGNAAILVEQKSGYLPVARAHSNIQLRIQALCLNAEYPHVTEIVGAIAQYRFTGAWSSVHYGPRELDMARRELELKLWMAEDIDAPLNAGEWCRYCRAKAVCPSAAAFSLLPVATLNQLEPLTKDNVQALVQRLPLEQMATLRKNKSIIEKILEAVGEQLRRTPLAELNKVGLTIGKASEGRAVKEAGMAQHILLEAGLITREEFETCVKVVGGRLEEIVVDRIAAKDGIPKKEAKAALWNLLGPATEPTHRAAPIRALKEDK